MWCLKQLGGTAQFERAANRSRYAKRVADCIDALNILWQEFPNPEARPYGEKSLLAEISLPFAGREGIERVIDKIKTRRWTKYDLDLIKNSHTALPS